MRSIFVEKWLDDEAVPYTYDEHVAVSRIDKTTSLLNQARLEGPLDVSLVASYREALRQGAIFPAGVVYNKGEKLVFIDGNHRFEAEILEGAKEIDLYIIGTDDTSKIDLLTRSANTMTGKRPSTEEVLAQAAYFMQSHDGMSAKAAAHAFKLPENTLQTYIRHQSAAKRLVALGFSGDINKSTIGMLSTLHNDRALREVAILWKNARLPSPLLQEIVTDVRTKNTEADMLACVDSWRSREDIKARIERTAHGERNIRLTANQKLWLSLANLTRVLDEHGTYAALGLNRTEDVEKFKVATERVIHLIRKVRSGEGHAKSAVSAAS